MAVIGALRAELSAGIARFQREMTQASGLVGTFAARSGISFAAVRNAALVAGGAITALVAGIATLATRGSQVQRVQGSFDGLATAAGLVGDEMIRLTQGATQGLITDLQIMEAANKALLLGLPVTEQGFADLADIAVVLGRAMGQDATKSLDDLTTALGRSSPLILDNLGITVSLGDANKIYAAELGKTVQQLTDAEKKQAFFNEALRKGKEAAEAIGAVTLTLGDRWVQLTTRIQNVIDKLAALIAKDPVLNAAFGSIQLAIDRAFGVNQDRTIRTIIATVQDLALIVIDVGRFGVTAAQILHRAWSGIATIYNAVLTVVLRLGAAIAAFVGQVAGLAADLGVLEGSMVGVEEEARAVEQRFMAWTAQTAAQTAESAKAVLGQGTFQEALRGLKGTLDDTKAAMEEATLAEEAAGDAAVIAAPQIDTLTASERALDPATSGATTQLREQKVALDGIDIQGQSSKATLDAFIRSQGIMASGLQGLPSDILAVSESFAGYTTVVDTAVLETERLSRAINPGGGGFFDGFRDSFNDIVTGITGGNGIEGLFQNLGAGIIQGLGNIVSGGMAQLTQLALQGLASLGQRIGRWVANLFGRSTADNIALTFERLWGVTIPDHVAEGLAVIAKKVDDDFAAMLLGLQDVFDGMGGLMAFGFEEGALAARDLFSMIEMGRIDADTAFKTLIGLLDDFADNFDSADAAGQAAFLELIRLAKQFGFDMDAIVAIVGQDLVNQALGDLQTETQGAADEFTALGQEADAAAQQAQQEVDRLTQELDDAERHLRTLEHQFATTGQVSEAEMMRARDEVMRLRGEVDQATLAVQGTEREFDNLATQHIPPVQTAVGNLGGDFRAFEGEAVPAVQAVGSELQGVAGSAGGIKDQLRGIDWADFKKKGVDAADSVFRSVNKISFGASPGGLKEIPRFLSRSIDLTHKLSTEMDRGPLNVSLAGTFPSFGGMESRLATIEAALARQPATFGRALLEALQLSGM